MAHDEHHILPKSTLFWVFGALIVLTVITVAVAYVPLGPLNVPIAVGIAASKATLVVLYFMHLKYDNPVNVLTFSIGIIFVALFIGITLVDTILWGDLDHVNATSIEEIERRQQEAQERQEQLSPEQMGVTPADNPEAQGPEDGGNAPTEEGS